MGFLDVQFEPCRVDARVPPRPLLLGPTDYCPGNFTLLESTIAEGWRLNHHFSERALGAAPGD